MKFIIGVDGGGTKTTIVLSDLKGNILHCIKSGPFEYLGSNFIKDRLIVFLIPLINKIISNAKLDVSDCKAVYMGITGLESVEEKKEVEKIFKELWINVKVRVESDAIIAFNAATYGKPGVMIIAGTGSVAYGEDGRGKSIRVGGLGPIIGDEGSGYDIGRKGIVAAVKSEDGRGKKSILEDLIKEELRLKEVRDIQFPIYKKNNSRETIASIAPIVKKAAELGDRVALDILYDASVELAKIAVAAVKVLKLRKCIVAITGGIFGNYYEVFESFKKNVCNEVSDVVISISEREPAEGAIILAIKDLKKTDIQYN